MWRAVNQNGPVEIQAPNGAYFVMQLFVGEPLFLVTGHAVDLRVVDYIKSIEFAGSFYSQIEQAMQRSQLLIFVVCGAIALLMLLAAVWLAILFASRLTEPIGGLMAAAERVRGGDLTARVEEGPLNDELGQLTRSFNRMASQIEQQRGDLIDANKELDTRRRLTDAVLAGVSAGVLSVDSAGIVIALQPLGAGAAGLARGRRGRAAADRRDAGAGAAGRAGGRATRPASRKARSRSCRAARGASCWCASVRRRMQARSSPSTTSPT